MRLALQNMPVGEAAAYGKRGSAATHRSQVLDQCPSCGLWFKILARHAVACRPVAPKTPKGHAKCVECGRLAPYCCHTQPKPPIAASQETTRTLEADRADFQEMKDAISLDAPEFGATEDIVIAAWVMTAGMWRRNPRDIQKMIRHRAQIQHILEITERLSRAGIWTDDGLVVLGEMDGTFKAAIEFWMNAMVGAGVIQGEYREGEGIFYRAYECDSRRAG